MLFGGSNMLLTAGSLLLAMVLGALLALIAVELRKRSRRRAMAAARLTSGSGRHSEEEKQRRQDVVARLMGLYSGVHSADALSDFLNRELERRHEAWRVRIPIDGPGEIYDLDPA